MNEYPCEGGSEDQKIKIGNEQLAVQYNDQ